MAKNVRIVLHQGVVRSELLKSAAIAGAVSAAAQAMASSLGPGYVVEQRQLSTRVGSLVRPETEEAINDNSQNNTLAKASRRKVRT